VGARPATAKHVLKGGVTNVRFAAERGEGRNMSQGKLKGLGRGKRWWLGDNVATSTWGGKKDGSSTE